MTRQEWAARELRKRLQRAALKFELKLSAEQILGVLLPNGVRRRRRGGV